jgi:hypothetical protein
LKSRQYDTLDACGVTSREPRIEYEENTVDEDRRSALVNLQTISSEHILHIIRIISVNEVTEQHAELVDELEEISKDMDMLQ